MSTEKGPPKSLLIIMNCWLVTELAAQNSGLRSSVRKDIVVMTHKTELFYIAKTTKAVNRQHCSLI